MYGKVITFHSYKGGTGRSMALANVACLLARRGDPRGRGVLMIDWDLEAPGLHNYFDRHIGRSGGAPEGRPGLIDFFVELRAEAERVGRVSEDEAEAAAYAVLNRVAVEQFLIQTELPGLSLLKAGRFDGNYFKRCSKFDWLKLFRLSPALLPLLAERLAERFAYVLIDSRSGHADAAGITTSLMPEKLVAVFTPNLQSIDGTLSTVRTAVRYRTGSDDLRPLVVFPLPTRVEPAEVMLREQWRQHYQGRFEEVFSDIYGLGRCDLGPYFDEVQVQHSPRYSYGEEIAVLSEDSRNRFSLAASYELFCDWLTRRKSPWE